MNKDALDEGLERLFQETFGLTQEQEDAFWRGLSARRVQEGQVWSAFAAIMIQANAGVKQAMQWIYWPARGLPGIG